MSESYYKKAVKIFTSFTGQKPEYVDTVQFPIYATVAGIGNVDAIQYSTVRDGVKETYVHEFKKGCRPVLAVSPDGKQLYLLAGAYKFTSNGIKDGRR